MKFIEYLVEKGRKAGKQSVGALWATTSISSKEKFIFNKGIESLNFPFFRLHRGDKKTFEFEGYKFIFGVGMDLVGYTQIETPAGDFIKVIDGSYKTQKSYQLKYFINK